MFVDFMFHVLEYLESVFRVFFAVLSNFLDAFHEEFRIKFDEFHVVEFDYFIIDNRNSQLATSNG